MGGSIATTGGSAASDGNGGPGGAITLNAADATSEVYIQGTSVNTSGGNAIAVAALRTAGPGGSVTVDGDARMDINGSLVLRGGTATSVSAGAHGGNGGSLSVNTAGNTGPQTLFGTVDRGGGSASGGIAGTLISGGNGGNLTIGAASPGGAPANVSMAGGLSARGGIGGGIAGFASSGGAGGSVTLRNNYGPGNLDLRGPIDVSGGDGEIGGGGGSITLIATTGNMDVQAPLTALGGNSSFGSAGNGGAVTLTLGNAGVAASGVLTVTGSIVANGGSASGSFDNGGNGGNVTITVDDSTAGVSASAAVDINTFIALNGGSSGAPADGADAGGLSIMSQGSVTLGGTILAQGGSSPSVSWFSFGGRGGFVDVLTDPGLTGTGAAITLNGSIDVSGGRCPGNGGDARNDGLPFSVGNSIFQVAVRFRAGTGAGGGAVTNNGTITATGAFFAGYGGDVRFEGSGAGVPAQGIQDRSGSGSALSGDFAGV